MNTPIAIIPNKHIEQIDIKSLRGFYENYLGALPFIFTEILSTHIRKTVRSQSDRVPRYG
jgi:hypothetical protein